MFCYGQIDNYEKQNVLFGAIILATQQKMFIKNQPDGTNPQGLISFLNTGGLNSKNMWLMEWNTPLCYYLLNLFVYNDASL